MYKPPAPGEPEPKLRPLKITVVGDGTVGKTCFVIAYCCNCFPEDHKPTVFDNYAMTLCVDQVKFSLILCDTAGQEHEEYEKLRLLSYPKTDAFIVCYAINNRPSFANIETKWIPEIRHHVPNAAIILLGTKLDLKSGGGDIITKQEAKSREGLVEVYIEAVRAVMRNHNSSGGQRICKFL